VSYDAGDGWQTAEVRGKLVDKQAKMLRDREAVLKRAKRFYQQGRDEEARHLITGYASKLDDVKISSKE